MTLLQYDEWHLGYKQIIHDCNQSFKQRGILGRVILLSSTDTDAICASRILCHLLQADGICYELRPCNSYPKFLSIIESLETDVVGVVCLNIGAMRNLSRLKLSEKKAKLYIIDSHRPFHLGNIHAGDNVVVFFEGWRDNEDPPSDGDNLSGKDESSDEESSSSEEESLGDEGEHELGGNQGYTPTETKRSITPSPAVVRSKKRRLLYSDDEEETLADDVSDLQEEAENDADDDSRKILPLNTLSLKEQRKARRRRIIQYYASGTFHSVPASFTAFQLSQQLRFSNYSNLLWLSCVGLSDAHLHHRLSSTGYDHLASMLSSHVKRLFPQDLLSKSLKALYASDNTPISVSEQGAILNEKDFNFFLLRHSSLYDSMTNTADIALHFELWRRDGVEYFRELLAKMGFPLRQCKQPFFFMLPSLRRRLKEALEEFGPEYGLKENNLFYQGFFKITGYQTFLSAADTAYAVSALLELPYQKEDMQNATEEQRMNEYFHRAYEALSSPLPLQRGLQLAKNLQKHVLSTAIALDEKNAIVRLVHFRYAYLRHGLDEDQVVSSLEIFSNPLALTRLAHFIVLMKLHQLKQPSNLPIVLLAEKPNHDFLVLGYNFSFEEEIVKNRFESMFELAAESIGAEHVKFESFLGNAVEVDGKHVQRFMEQLHLLMDAV